MEKVDASFYLHLLGNIIVGLVDNLNFKRFIVKNPFTWAILNGYLFLWVFL